MKEQHILIVDDNSKNVQVLAMILSEQNYRIIVANNGIQALKSLEKIIPDLILLDINMPEMDGFETCKRIKESEKLASIPIIFLTAEVEINRIIQGFALGASDYITKPFNSKELLARVKTHIELKESKDIIIEQNSKLNDLLRQLNEKNILLTELNSTKDKFFSIIAHDLKNPFNSIIGFCELLIGSVKELEYAKIIQYLEIIKSSSKKAYDLLDNLLLWARSQTGNIELQPISFDLKNLALDTISLVKTQASNKNIQITLDIKNEHIVFGDMNMINTVLRNILSNAIKFTNMNGKVFVYINEKNNDHELCIKDTGVGISSENIKKLFKITGNYHTAGTNNESGTGLGLILCKEFIEKNGGTILVESEKGVGSEFKIVLPKYQNHL